MENNQLDKSLALKLIFSAGISLFWVLFLWNFWSRGVYALGVNAFVFGSLVMALFLYSLHQKRKLDKKDLAWIVPIALMVLSFLIYDNPFLKVISIIVVPLAFAFFYNYAYLADRKKIYWGSEFIYEMIRRILSFTGKIGKSATYYLELIIPAKGKNKKVISKIIIGVGLFLVIALTVFIPLLSSADPVFADTMGTIYDWVLDFFEKEITYKIIFFLGFSIFISSALLAWGNSKDSSFVKTAEDKTAGEGEIEKQIDPIISGIVLSGILIIYLIFLAVQLNRLFVGSLPFDFKETESMVKSGFWQLFFLSIINIAIYLATYRKTIPAVQKILTAFTFASLFLLFSAGQRMALYAVYYGLSYEKFFASYTVIYCTILFGWLIYRLFTKEKADIIKFVVILFIWMYGIITIFPVESFIFNSNMKLSKMEGSRIALYEMTMLSPDVLLPMEENFSWEGWTERQRNHILEKQWYEMNILNIRYLLNSK